MVNAFLLMWVSYSSAVIKTRTGLPVFLYLLICGATISKYSNWQGQVVVLLILLSCKLLLGCYRRENSSEESFLCGILIGISILFQPETIILLLLFSCGLYIQRAFSIKSVFALLIGVSVVAIYFFLAVCFNFSELPDWQTISAHMLMLNMINIMVSALGLFMLIGCLREFRETSISIQSFIMVFSALLIFAVAFMYCGNPYINNILPLALVSVTALATHYFTSRETVFSGVAFILYIVIWGAYYVYVTLV